MQLLRQQSLGICRPLLWWTRYFGEGSGKQNLSNKENDALLILLILFLFSVLFTVSSSHDGGVTVGKQTTRITLVFEWDKQWSFCCCSSKLPVSSEHHIILGWLLIFINLRHLACVYLKKGWSGSQPNNRTKVVGDINSISHLNLLQEISHSFQIYFDRLEYFISPGQVNLTYMAPKKPNVFQGPFLFCVCVCVSSYFTEKFAFKVAHLAVLSKGVAMTQLYLLLLP